MRYRAEVDGLRALAVVPVILFHAGYAPFAGGFVGVDVFFVISGYLITTIILGELKTGTFSLLHFYERRARRILPALYLVMLASLPFAFFWMMERDLRDFAQSLVAVSTFSSNILFWLESDYFDTAAELKPMLHTWSLAVEEQYYIFFPLFLMATWRFGLPLVLGMLVVVFTLSFCLGVWGSNKAPSAAFFLLPTRGWEILLGAFAAFILDRNPAPLCGSKLANLLGLSGLGLILIAVFTFSHATPFPGFYTLLPTVGAFLILLFSFGDSISKRLLSWRPFVGIGLISYSAYLWHQPLFAFTRYSSPTVPSPVLMGVLCLATFPLAYLTWRFVEAPFRKRTGFGRGAIFSMSLAGGVAMMATGLAVAKYPQSFSRAPNYEVSVRNYDRDTCDVDGYHARYCRVIGDVSETPRILLWGDSHAQAIGPRLHHTLAEQGLSAYTIMLGGCTPVPGVALDYTEFEECIALSRATLDMIHASDTLHTVILSSRWASHFEGGPFDNGEGGVEHFKDRNRLQTELDSGEFGFDVETIRQRYTDLVQGLAHLNLIVVLPIPEAGWHVPRYFSNHVLSGKFGPDEFPPLLGSTSAARYIERNQPVSELLTNGVENVRFVDPFHLFCTETADDGSRRCITHQEGTPLYFDDDHLSYAGAGRVVDEIMRHLK